MILLERNMKTKLIENIRVGKFETICLMEEGSSNRMVEKTLSTMEIFA